MKNKHYLLAIAFAILALPYAFGRHANESFGRQQIVDESPLIALGTNSNMEIPESSGLANSTYVNDAIWTVNDSGNSNEVFLLRTDGQLLARIELRESKNIDWESMARFTRNGVSYLLVADVGDNQRSRTDVQIYMFVEPDFSAEIKARQKDDLPIVGSLKPTQVNLTFEGGPRDCEAVGVDMLTNQVWFVEKIFYNRMQAGPPGIFALPITFEKPTSPLVAKRIADFPIRGVTGMDFAPDGKHLIVRNYVNAHLFSRANGQTWETVVRETKPKEVVLPLQRQGETICFTRDSKSVIVTSETTRQMIWQVKLAQYFESNSITQPIDQDSIAEKTQPEK